MKNKRTAPEREWIFFYTDTINPLVKKEEDKVTCRAPYRTKVWKKLQQRFKSGLINSYGYEQTNNPV